MSANPEPNAVLMWEPVQLGWAGRLAAFWLLFWPAWLISVVALVLVPASLKQDATSNHQFLSSLAVNLLALLLQACLIPRMIRKHYRAFRIAAIRPSGLAAVRLSLFEIVMIAARILWPQIVLLAVSSLLATVVTRRHIADLQQSLPGIIMSTRVLIIGPLCISLAVPEDYGSFRLEVFAARFSTPPPPR